MRWREDYRQTPLDLMEASRLATCRVEGPEAG
jgi:hypothetical protein